MKKIINTIAGILILVNTYSTTYNVSTSGSDTKAGSAEKPWRTIAKSISIAKAGDVVLIKPGFYNERSITSRAGTSSSRIIFKGDGGLVKNNGWQIDHSFITVDGFLAEGSPVPNNYQPVISIGKAVSNVWIFNCKIQNIDTKIWGIKWMTSGGLPEQAASYCVVSNTIMKNIQMNMMMVFGKNHLIISNVFDTTNDQDSINIWGSGTRITGNLFTNIGGGLELGGHPDVLQTFGDNGFQSYNHMFDNNYVINSPCQIFMSSEDGIENIRDFVFFNNIFVGMGAHANDGIQGIKYYNNTFFLCTSNTANVMSFSPRKKPDGSIQDSPEKGAIINNLFFMCAEPDNIAGGYYVVSNEMTNVITDYNFVCGRKYGAKRPECPRTPFRFCETNGINGGNPMFVDENKLDLRLAQNSPLIGRGLRIQGFHGQNEIVNIGANNNPFMSLVTITTNKLLPRVDDLRLK